MRKHFILSVALAALGICGAQTPVAAQERALVDNWNTAACGFTDAAHLTLNAPTTLTRIDIWYNWQPGEGAVSYSLFGNGAPITAGTLMRAECDPYQGSWCVARDTPNLQLAPGEYEFRAATAQICQNAGSRGDGFIKAYGR